MAQRIKTVAHYFHSTPDNTLAYHRVIGPARHLGLNIIHGYSYSDKTITLDCIASSDLVVIQRDFPRFYDEYNQIIALARKKKKRVILDIDDLLLELPENHPDRFELNYNEALLPMFQACHEVDAITVTSLPLKRYLESYNSQVFVLPNFLNDELWSLKPPKKASVNDQHILIGYMGGHSHALDLAQLASVLSELFIRYPQKLKFICWGVEPPKEIIQYPNVRHVPLELYHYPAFAEFFQKQSVDIFVAPLVDNLFNSCKSAIKFLEYTALGAPGVYSDLPPYANAITHGHDGFIASTSEDWLEFLIELIEKPELRYKMACNAQEKVRKKWLLSRNASLWLDAYRATLESSSTNHAYPFLNSLRSITAQTIEMKRKITQQLDFLQGRIADQTRNIEEYRSKVIEKETQLQQLNAKLEEREQQNRQLAMQVTNLEEQVYQLNTTLREIYASTDWKLVLFLRKIRMPFLLAISLGKQIIQNPILLWFSLGKLKRYYHLNENLNLIRSSALFDPGWYLHRYPDVERAGIDPAKHFLLYGGFEGRDPGPGFSTQWYLENYPDVANSGINPLIHYIRFGEKQKRNPKPQP